MLEECKQLADDPQYASSPPGEFIEMLGLRGASYEFLCNAWELFKQRRDRISPNDVVAYMDQKKEGLA